METRDFICVCLGVDSEKVDEICDNFDIDIEDSDVYEILNIFAANGYKRFGDNLIQALYCKVIEKAKEELGLQESNFEYDLCGFRSHLYYRNFVADSWEALEGMATAEKEQLWQK